jgi:hypothetical protein
MPTQQRTFEDRPAVRESVPLLIGITGPSGGGKTFSALRLATGIQTVSGGEIYAIDTEARRCLNYAEKFKFRHLEFKAPFGPLDYLAAVEHCVAKGAKVIIVDSMSHEHEGPGGVLEMHQSELDRMGGDMKKTFLAWAKPKSERRRFINAILQMNVNFVFCFRAKEKMKVIPGQTPKEMGFMPIAGEEFVFEMTANCLLMPNANGVPTWMSEYAGEKMMMKLPEQFKTILTESRQLDEEIGRQLAVWARGEDPLIPLGDTAASAGTPALEAWWKSITAADRVRLKDKLAPWKDKASAVNVAAGTTANA